ncbi:hypothetical protein PPYR_11726 [Photinus pyralis]|uniref:Scavenger receptor class B member 1 n=1 Tax=Photinus pyralis TaxID=7054 RepID=A0A1Y1LKM5_PHOPY|nr:protein peste-like [Photinus pyralis]XP_031352049.1 protein peste-like [Photinus pyralis]XP_031352050.1 protein peste-like [Photinus pyralis]XP_031352051.1 protein peste-like [Photinus pyralis]XP_031352053.1 protein peste-like [Photinus pyralis]XP_031352054.1 protein peste-like [Photinus pyralis]XP_031352055.1 protein peste-like [Photinus pyralis]XP_031352056.1 protein peste-like [Photinus pyralis]KAB0794887.1 hypothetical protein PPYR_11726 [Photinus pyralis]
MRAINMWNKILLTFGVTLIVVGLVLLFCFSSLVTLILNNSLTLSANSKAFEEWRKTRPIPMDMYFFNWTNPDDIYNPDIKPNFEEVGPYKLFHVREKVNITWNDNDTVTYKHLLSYYYDDNSPSNLSDVITTIDMVALSMAQRTKDSFFFVKNPVKLALMFSNIYVRKTARELMSGYETSIMAAANALNFVTGENAPDKFGYLYAANQTIGFDGTYNVRNTVGDDFGALKNWNYNNFTLFYEGQCGKINGSAGELYPQNLKPDHITFFSADLCRPLEFTFEENQTVEGIPSYKYSAKDAVFDNGTLVTRNKCFCTGRCFPSGVLDNSACRSGVPLFSSLPHFYYADEFYRNKIDGMKPDKDKHEFYFTFEPNIGIVTSTAARLQVNVWLEPLEDFQLYKNVPELMIPIFWTQQQVVLYEEHVANVKLFLISPTISKISSLVMIVVGLVCIGYVLVILYLNERRVTKSKLWKNEIALK